MNKGLGYWVWERVDVGASFIPRTALLGRALKWVSKNGGMRLKGDRPCAMTSLTFICGFPMTFCHLWTFQAISKPGVFHNLLNDCIWSLGKMMPPLKTDWMKWAACDYGRPQDWGRGLPWATPSLTWQSAWIPGSHVATSPPHSSPHPPLSQPARQLGSGVKFGESRDLDAVLRAPAVWWQEAGQAPRTGRGGGTLSQVWQEGRGTASKIYFP